MKLEFELKQAYGRDRFYPLNDKAEALVQLTGRKCLRPEDIGFLVSAGYGLHIINGDKTLLDTDMEET